MEKKFLTLILVAALAIVIGISFVSKQSKDPVLQELLKQQAEILRNQTRLENKLPSSMGADSSTVGLMAKQQMLEQRIAALENQWKVLQDLIKGAQNNAGNPQAAQPPQQEDLTQVYDIPVGDSPIIGAKDAPVTIVEFVDFQCPFCARFHAPIEEVLKAYPGKVRYIIKNFPLVFHPMSRPAAKAALAANEQGKFEEMVNGILSDNSNLSEDHFKELAQKLGLNVNKFLQDYKDKDARWEDRIKNDQDIAVKVQVRGTPTFYLNGRRTESRDVASWKREIDAILNTQ